MRIKRKAWKPTCGLFTQLQKLRAALAHRGTRTVSHQFPSLPKQSARPRKWYITCAIDVALTAVESNPFIKPRLEGVTWLNMKVVYCASGQRSFAFVSQIGKTFLTNIMEPEWTYRNMREIVNKNEQIKKHIAISWALLLSKDCRARNVNVYL